MFDVAALLRAAEAGDTARTRPSSDATRDSIAIREATAADVPALARLHVTTFNETHVGPFGRGPSYELRERQWRETLAPPNAVKFVFLAEASRGELVGFAAGARSDGSLGFQGELDKIYVLRGHHRRGIGRRLVCHVVKRFLTQGVSSMVLFGDANNPSNGFYERLGAERLYNKEGEFHGGYGWRNLLDLGRLCDATSTVD